MGVLWGWGGYGAAPIEMGGFGQESLWVQQAGEGKEPPSPFLESLAIPGLQVVKVYSEDGACRSVEVAAGATARYVCEMLVQRARALSDENWGLVECHPHLALGELGCQGLSGQGGDASHLGLGRCLPGLRRPLLFALDPRAGLRGP